MLLGAVGTLETVGKSRASSRKYLRSSLTACLLGGGVLIVKTGLLENKLANGHKRLTKMLSLRAPKEIGYWTDKNRE